MIVSSVVVIKGLGHYAYECLADVISQSFVGLVAKALDDNYRRYSH